MRWQIKPHNKKQFDMLRDAGIAPMFSALLSNRSFSHVKTKEDIKTLIESQYELMESPTAMSGMDMATDILIDVKGKHAVVFGDYDVDGIVASFICEKLLLRLKASSVDVYLPSRIDDGYGLNERSVVHFLSICDKNYELVVILDCGSSSNEQINNIKKRLPNAKIVVMDHHIISENNFSKDADVVVNPRMCKATKFCAAGIVFQAARLCSQKGSINAMKFLPYAAIATIADVCELTGSNRILVKNGINSLKDCKDKGLMALFRIVGIQRRKCNSEDISYRIGPMLNAAGRIRRAEVAYRLLKSINREKADEIAQKLYDLNEKRKEIQNKTKKEAIEIFEAEGFDKESAFLYQKDWNPSVVGIVASKVSEKYGVPTICFGKSKGDIKGSARSVEGINIKKVMDNCSHLFERYGGHEMAAGATLKDGVLPQAWEEFDKAVRAYKRKHKIGAPVFRYDYEVDKDLLLRMDDVFCDRLAMLEPYGSANETPIFKASNLFCREVTEWKSKTGGFVYLDNTGLNCFVFGKELLWSMSKINIDILFSICRSFIDGEKWQIKIVACRESGTED